MTFKYYDKQGNVISREQVIPLSKDQSYRRVGETTIKGRCAAVVSTVWLCGINHNFIPGGPPLIFETMVFQPSCDLSHSLPWKRINLAPYKFRFDGYQWRYATEQEALEGHNRVVEFIKRYHRNRAAKQRIASVQRKRNRKAVKKLCLSTLLN